jgi:hypothetical protein
MLAATLSSALEARREQIFPTLTTTQIHRLERFGSMRTYAAGSALLPAGRPAPGPQVIIFYGQLQRHNYGAWTHPPIPHQLQYARCS